MKSLVLVALLIPAAASAGPPTLAPVPRAPSSIPALPPAPPQFCMSQTRALALSQYLQGAGVLLQQLSEDAQEPARQKAAIDAAVAQQKADDEAAAKAPKPADAKPEAPH